MAGRGRPRHEPIPRSEGNRDHGRLRGAQRRRGRPGWNRLPEAHSARLGIERLLSGCGAGTRRPAGLQKRPQEFLEPPDLSGGSGPTGRRPPRSRQRPDRERALRAQRPGRRRALRQGQDFRAVQAACRRPRQAHRRVDQGERESQAGAGAGRQKGHHYRITR